MPVPAATDFFPFKSGHSFVIVFARFASLPLPSGTSASFDTFGSNLPEGSKIRALEFIRSN
jgi:hypothetical protein